MSRYIARINILVDATSSTHAHERLIDVISGRPGVESWDYVTIDVDKTGFMPIPEPDLDDLFEAAISDDA